MNVVRYELRTGVLVVTTLAIVAAVLVYYGAAGGFRELKRFQVYFDDAGGIQPGASVTLSGRKIGQVRRLLSPIPERDRPRPELQVIVEVEVAKAAQIFREQKVVMLQYGLLGDQIIDFTSGVEASGLAPPDWRFIGERQVGLNDAAPRLLAAIEPVMAEATKLVKELQKTAERLTAITAEGSDFNLAVTNYKKLGEELTDIMQPGGPFRETLSSLEKLTGPDGGVQRTVRNLEEMTGAESPLTRALKNAEKFTGSLAENQDLGATLRNFRQASEKLNTTVGGVNSAVKQLTPCLQVTARNAAQFTDTVKRQPWRLIWPSTKKYPEDQVCYVRVRAGEEVVAEKLKRPVWASPTPGPPVMMGKCKKD